MAKTDVLTLKEVDAFLPQLSVKMGRLMQMHHLVRESLVCLQGSDYVPESEDFSHQPQGADDFVIDHLTTLKVVLKEIKKQVGELKGFHCEIRSIDHGIVDITPIEKDGEHYTMRWRMGGEQKMIACHPRCEGNMGDIDDRELFGEDMPRFDKTDQVD